ASKRELPLPGGAKDRDPVPGPDRTPRGGSSAQ
ncbi:MAG: hypothetical protein AVDCRST_MAG01-01-429, partial [uncultured Rubrobacteraceae bacterium]